jgi:hypothetical protein
MESVQLYSAVPSIAINLLVLLAGIPEQARPLHASSLITALPPSGRRQTRYAF